jgi:multidrug efflux pump subunit AcrA (membrane-fusion protein)
VASANLIASFIQYSNGDLSSVLATNQYNSLLPRFAIHFFIRLQSNASAAPGRASPELLRLHEANPATAHRLKETFDLKRKAAQASIRILEIQRDRTRETMLHAQANSALMEIHAPIDGIVVFNTIWKQGNMGEVQEGDQVRPGVPFMQVVDPSIMEVQVRVNQEDLLGLKLGQKGQVHLDAYSDLVFDGQLESVDPMGRTGDFSPKLRSFSATFSIKGHDPRLMPDLSAAVEVVPAGADSPGGGSK